jgi:DNA invertase Pin-like site-specific DNA recombinase
MTTAKKARKAKGMSAIKAVAYIRVSTEDQNLGPEAQRAAIERYASANGIAIVATFADQGMSGGAELEKRINLLAAIDALDEHKAGILLVAKRDRLARDLLVSAMVERLVERQGARIESADGVGSGTGPEAFMMRGMMDLFAVYERLVIKARTKAALAVKSARGERVGQIPFGLRLAADGRRLERDDAEQAVLATMRARRADGVTFEMIADELNAAGVPARGQRWHTTGVYKLLRRADAMAATAAA